MGFVTLFAGNFAPNNWAFCNGQLLPVAKYTTLFGILSTTYGGNGTTTFGLPNLQSRAAVGVGQAPGMANYPLGQTGGSEISVITLNQMPAHSHPIIAELDPGSSTTVNSTTPQNAVYATGQSSLYNYYADDVMQAYSGTLTIGNTGYDPKNTPTPFPCLHPVLGLNYIICLTGTFPSRG